MRKGWHWRTKQRHLRSTVYGRMRRNRCEVETRGPARLMNYLVRNERAWRLGGAGVQNNATPTQTFHAYRTHPPFLWRRHLQTTLTKEIVPTHSTVIATSNLEPTLTCSSPALSPSQLSFCSSPPQAKLPNPFLSTYYAGGKLNYEKLFKQHPEANYLRHIYWLKRFALWTKSVQKDNGK